MTETNELSEREQEVLSLVATGASNKEIAQQLYISTNTVKVHLRNIYPKIGVASRTEAAMYAVNSGLISSLAQGEKRDYDGGDDSILITEDKLGSVSRRSFRPYMIVLIGVGVIIVVVTLVYMIINSRLGPQEQFSSPAEIPRWQTMADMPTARFGLAVTSIENKIYAIGGENDVSVLGTVEIYDPDKNSWSVVESKPTPVTDIQAVVIGGRIYVPGGRTDSGELTNVLEIYDYRKEVWLRGKNLPVALSAYGLVAHEGKIYLFGGFDGKDYVSNVYYYDPQLDVWENIASMPIASGYVGVASIRDRIYVIGGFDGERALSSNNAFIPAVDTADDDPWVTSEPLPDSLYGMGVATIADIIYLVGGSGESERVSEIFAYFPNTDQWGVVDTPENKIGSSAGAVSIGANVFAIGGNVMFLPSSNNQMFQAIFTVSIPVIVK